MPAITDVVCDLSKSASGDGTEANPYNPSELASYLKTVDSMTEDVEITLLNKLQITDGNPVDFSTPNLSGSFKVEFVRSEKSSEQPYIWSEQGNYNDDSLLIIGGGSSSIRFTDAIVFVSGDLNKTLKSLVKVIGINEVILANDGLIANNLSNFYGDMGGGCCDEMEFFPVISTPTTKLQTNTVVIHTTTPTVLNLPSENQEIAEVVNNQVILGGVGYGDLFLTDVSTKAEANHFHTAGDAWVLSLYETSVQTPAGIPDTGAFDNTADEYPHKLRNVTGSVASIDLRYDSGASKRDGIDNILDPSVFDAAYTDFSSFLKYPAEPNNAGYYYLLEEAKNEKGETTPPGNWPQNKTKYIGAEGGSPNFPTGYMGTTFGILKMMSLKYLTLIEQFKNYNFIGIANPRSTGNEDGSLNPAIAVVIPYEHWLEISSGYPESLIEQKSYSWYIKNAFISIEKTIQGNIAYIIGRRLFKPRGSYKNSQAYLEKGFVLLSKSLYDSFFS